MEKLDYQEDLRIDPEALDLEWLKQAELMRKYTKHAAQMKAEMDSRKEELDFLKAEIEMNIRQRPENYDLSKVTESAIQSTILQQGEYKAISREFNEAKYEYEIASGAVRAIDQKKAALENLVRLFLASYFAGPKAPRDLAQESLQQQERRLINAKSNAKVRMTRTKKKGDD